MFTINAYAEQIQCDKAERGIDYIKVYRDVELIREDNNISDFSGYRLIDENGNPVEFSAPEPTEAEQMKADLDYIAIVTGVEL